MNHAFPVSLNLVGRRCVVIGSDREAVEKEAALREAGALVQWIRDPAAISDGDIINAYLIISTPQDAELSMRLRELAEKHRVLLCCIDQPHYGFVSMAAIAKAGPVRVAISTTGRAPRVAKIMKEALQHAMDQRFVRFIDCQAIGKERNRERFPDSSAKRRNAMIELADGFQMGITLRYPHWFKEGEQIEVSILRLLQTQSRTVAVAESCTGGLLSAALTETPGASRSFLGAVVAYDNSIKIDLLGVKEQELIKHGAVSAEVAAAMAMGIRSRLKSSIGLSVTGIAGPEGGTPEKPLGLVWLGIADQAEVRTYCMRYSGDRAAVRMQATRGALELLWEHLMAPTN